MTYYCERCRQDLYGYPKININGQIYCYRCSEAVVKEISKQEVDDFKKSLPYKEFIDSKNNYLRELQIWEEKSKQLKSKNWSLAIYFGIPLMIFLRNWDKGKITLTGDTTVDIILCILYFIIAGIINIKIENKREIKFNLSNPKPIFSLIEPRSDFKVNSFLLPNDGSQTNPDEYPLNIYNRDDYTCQKCGIKKELKDLRLLTLRRYSKSQTYDPTVKITICAKCLQDNDHKDF